MQIDIRKWIMALAVVPLTVASLSLSWLFTREQIEQLQQAFSARSVNLATHLAFNTEYGVLAGNQHYLDRLLVTIVSEPDVVAATIFSADKTRLLSRGTPTVLNSPAKLPPRLSHWSEGHRQYISAPIIGARVELNDSYLNELSTSQADTEQSGWVLIEMTTQSITLQKQQIITRAWITTLVLMSFTLLLAVWLSRRILRPVTALSTAVTDLAQGKLESRVSNQSTGELGILERGFNDMAKALEQSHANMQQKIIAATANLQRANAQLEQQNQALELANYRANSANEAKTRFIANMSHELRTPVSSIIGFCRLLSKTNTDDTTHRQITFIEQSASHLLGIINDVLEFASIEEGKITLDPTPFNLREALHEVIYLMRPSAHEQDLTLACLVYDDVPERIIADGYRLKQVLINLIGNAIKFTTQGAIDIRCQILDEEDDEWTLCISIHDSGIGIPADKISSLFQPFGQIDTSNTRRHGGAGLGLMISRDLVQLMGGNITVTSNAEEGSTFEICWPVQSAETIESAKPLSGLAIALYDDNEFSKTTLRHTLSRLGAQCSLYNAEATDSSDMATAYVFSLTRAAIARGDLDTLTKATRKPTILIVNSSDPEQLQPAHYHGAVDYCLPRPAHPHELLTAFSRLGLIDWRDDRQAIATPPSEYRQTKVLVAEDAAINRELIQAQLNHHGIQALIVNDGLAAVEAAKQHAFDLIILDLHMPVMDGITAARRIREAGHNTQTSIVALTADITMTKHEDLSRYGIQEVILKPLSDETLVRLLQVTDHSQQGASEPEPVTDTADGGSDIMPIDIEFLLKQARGNTQFVRQTLDMLQQELTQQQPEIAHLIELEAWEEVRQLVHKIHGAASYCGTTKLKQAAHDMEAALIEQRLQQIEQYWCSLSQCMSEVITAIDQLTLDSQP